MADYSMIQECVDHYEVQERAAGAITIGVDVPARFRDLWLVRLSELRVTDEEIKEHEPKLRLT